MDTGSTSALLAVLSRGDPGELLNALGEQCNLEARDKQGKNLLDVAALFGKPAAVRVLVEKGAPINSSNKSGYCALHWGAVWGRLPCLKELVALGAVHDARTRHGETAKDLAMRYNHTECVMFMDRVGARAGLRASVMAVRDVLGDSERMQGKWNKDDKSKVTTGCNEKLEWLDKTPDATLAEIEEQKKDFSQRMEPHLAKLSSSTN